MKKIVSLSLALLFVFTLCACGSDDVVSSDKVVDTDAPQETTFDEWLDSKLNQTKEPLSVEEEIEEFLSGVFGKRFRSLYETYGIMGWEDIYDQEPHELRPSAPSTFELVPMGDSHTGIHVKVPLPSPDAYEDAIDSNRNFGLDADGLYTVAMQEYKGDKNCINYLRGRENEDYAEYKVSFNIVTLSGIALKVTSKINVCLDDPYSYDDWCESVVSFFNGNDRYASRDKSSDDIYTVAFDGFIAGMRIVNDESGLIRDVDLCYSTDICQFLSELNRTGEIYNSVGYAIDVRVTTDVLYIGSDDLTDSQVAECKEFSEGCVRAFEEFIFGVYGLGSELDNVYNNTANFHI